MNRLLILNPVRLLLFGGANRAFARSSRRDQFDDLEASAIGSIARA